MADTLLITGTDTGVGKTWVACALARALRSAGYTVVAVKPVESGCAELPQGGEDGVLLAEATGQAEPTQALVRLADPIAPAVALEDSGASGIDLDALRLRIEGYARTADILLIEGAGGLLSPITWEWNAADLVRALGARALVVASDRLGTINHTLLTLTALALTRIPLAGVVLTSPEAPDASSGRNAAAIRRITGVERVLAAPRISDPAAAARALRPVLEWLAGGKPSRP